MPTIRTYEELGTFKNKLNEAVATGTLTTELLDEAITMVDHAGYETIPESIGWPWISKNHDAVVAVIGDVAEFVRRNLDTEDIDLVLYNTKLLSMVPQKEQFGLVRDVLLDGGVRNSHWARGLIEDLGIPRHDLGEIIIEMLAAATVKPQRRYNFAEHTFLAYGSGRVGCMRFPAGEFKPGLWRFEETLTLWSVLDDEQFMFAMRICAANCPQVFFDSYSSHELTVAQKLRIRLSDEQFDEILAEASKHLTSLHGVSFELFERLSPENQTTLLDRFDTVPVSLLAELALRRGFTGGGIELCMRFRQSFTEGGDQVVISNYRRLWNRLSTAEDQDMAKAILAFMESSLNLFGVAYGTAVEGTFFNKRLGRELPQVSFRHKGVKYVQKTSQMRYTAKNGDMVLVNTRYAQRPPGSTSLAFAVFIPADGRITNYE